MDELREVTITPDRYTTYRYAGASGDFNPIHLDDEFAQSVGLPSKILHGLWTMAQVARAQTEAVGDPLALKSLSCSSAGWACPSRRSRSRRSSSPGRWRGRFDCEAVQDGNKLVRRGRAVLRI